MSTIKIIDSKCEAYESIWRITKEEGFEIINSYVSCHSKILFQIQKMLNLFPFFKKERWYNKQLINMSGTCVVFDSNTTEDFLRWLMKNNPNARLIFYYWNAFEEGKSIHPETVRSIGYEVWSFDPKDCQRYDMNFNAEFFCRSWYSSLNLDIKPQYDISFIGRDKNGRMEQVYSLKKKYEKYGLKWSLYFTANHWYQRFSNRNYHKFLSYQQTLQKQSEAVAILDYAQEKQSSITLRVFDAVCNGRKVITNNTSICNEKIYNKQDFFVIGLDDDSNICEFLNTPFEPIDEKILEERSIVGWGRRFNEPTAQHNDSE